MALGFGLRLWALPTKQKRVPELTAEPAEQAKHLAKKYFEMTPRGVSEVRRTQAALSKLSGGLRQLKDRRLTAARSHVIGHRFFWFRWVIFNP